MQRRQFLQFSSLAVLAISMAGGFVGCGVPVATWIQMGLGLINTVLPTIPSIIAAFQGLTGKGLTPAQVAKLQAIFTGAQDLFSQALALVQQYQAHNDNTLIAKIQDILNQLKTTLNLQQILADVQVSNPAVVAKITTVVNSFIELANDVLIILPSVSPTGQVHARKVSQAQMARLQPTVWAARFNASLATSNGKDAEVDAAFASVKAVPK